MILKSDLESMSLTKLVGIYNILNPGNRVVGFRNKQTAVQRVMSAIDRATAFQLGKLKEKFPELGPQQGGPEAVEGGPDATEDAEADAPDAALEAAMQEQRDEHEHEFVALAKAKPTRAVRAKERAASGRPGGERGRKAAFSGMRFVACSEINPRRPGSHGWRSMSIIIERGSEGISYEDFIQDGGRAVDLRWDIEHGNVVVKK